jgi:hypothetical protein
METLSFCHSLLDNQDMQTALKVSISPASPKCTSYSLEDHTQLQKKSDNLIFEMKYY